MFRASCSAYIFVGPFTRVEGRKNKVSAELTKENSSGSVVTNLGSNWVPFSGTPAGWQMVLPEPSWQVSGNELTSRFCRCYSFQVSGFSSIPAKMRNAGRDAASTHLVGKERKTITAFLLSAGTSASSHQWVWLLLFFFLTHAAPAWKGTWSVCAAQQQSSKQKNQQRQNIQPILGDKTPTAWSCQRTCTKSNFWL